VATVVDRALKGSMAGERMNNSFGREVREKEMSWWILKGENPLFFRGNSPFHNVHDDLSMGRMQREKTESKSAQGQTRRPHFAPKNSGIFPKIPI
jgi:hypothetical protein